MAQPASQVIQNNFFVLEGAFRVLCNLIDKDNLEYVREFLASQNKNDIRRLMAYKSPSCWQGTILHHAARWRHPEKCACELRKKNCGLVLPTYLRTYPDEPVKSNRLEIVRCLLEYGASKTITDYYDQTPYEYANLEDNSVFFSNQCHECLPALLKVLHP